MLKREEGAGGERGLRRQDQEGGEREFFIDNLLVRIHLIIEMILVDQPCAMEV